MGRHDAGDQNENVEMFTELCAFNELVTEGTLLVDSKRIAESGAVIVPIMLGVLKRKQLQRRIKGRSTDVPQRRANRYLKYFDNIWKLQSYLMSEADTAQVPIITNENREEVFREIMLTTITKLAEDFDKTPEQVFASS